MTTRPNAKLKMFLFQHGLTQRQLAFGAGIDEARISKAIRYGISTPEMRDRICDFLGAPRNQLFPLES